MGSKSCSKALLVHFLLLQSLIFHLKAQQQSIQVGFYGQTCPLAEYIIKVEVLRGVVADMGMAAGLVRLHFHDCFVRGCDASVLIDSTPSNKAEKESPPNFPSLRGFEIIDNIKARLELMCPGVVSCADILAYAARDATEMAGGVGYDVPAGRKDGRISRDTDALTNLPPPFAVLQLLLQIFAGKGLTQDDMVTLSGAHTIGRSHCTTITSRLFNFSTNTAQDPSIDSSYAAQLKQQCPSGSTDTTSVVPMDPSSPNKLDVAYYRNVMASRGLWQQKFAAAMVKMGRIGVLTGSAGEIRANCRVIN